MSKELKRLYKEKEVLNEKIEKEEGKVIAKLMKEYPELVKPSNDINCH